MQILPYRTVYFVRCCGSSVLVVLLSFLSFGQQQLESTINLLDVPCDSLTASYSVSSVLHSVMSSVHFFAGLVSGGVHCTQSPAQPL